MQTKINYLGISILIYLSFFQCTNKSETKRVKSYENIHSVIEFNKKNKRRLSKATPSTLGINFLRNHKFGALFSKGNNRLELISSSNDSKVLNFFSIDTIKNRIFHEFQFATSQNIIIEPSTGLKYNGNYYVAGSIKLENGEQGVFVIKVLANGSPDWTRYLGNPDYNNYAVTLLPLSNSIMVCMSTNDVTTNSDYTASSSVEIDENGNFVNIKSNSGSSLGFTPMKMIKFDNSDFYLQVNKLEMIENYEVISYQVFDYEKNEFQYVRYFPYFNGELAINDIKETSNGDLVFLGSIANNFGVKNRDAILIQIGPNYNSGYKNVLIANDFFEGDGNEEFLTMAETSDGFDIYGTYNGQLTVTKLDKNFKSIGSYFWEDLFMDTSHNQILSYSNQIFFATNDDDMNLILINLKNDNLNTINCSQIDSFPNITNITERFLISSWYTNKPTIGINYTSINYLSSTHDINTDWEQLCFLPYTTTTSSTTQTSSIPFSKHSKTYNAWQIAFIVFCGVFFVAIFLLYLAYKRSIKQAISLTDIFNKKLNKPGDQKNDKDEEFKDVNEEFEKNKMKSLYDEKDDRLDDDLNAIRPTSANGENNPNETERQGEESVSKPSIRKSFSRKSISNSIAKNFNDVIRHVSNSLSFSNQKNEKEETNEKKDIDNLHNDEDVDKIILEEESSSDIQLVENERESELKKLNNKKIKKDINEKSNYQDKNIPLQPINENIDIDEDEIINQIIDEKDNEIETIDAEANEKAFEKKEKEKE